MQTKSYKDIYTYRQRSVLPAEVQTAVYRLGEAINGQTGTQNMIEEYRNALRGLPASAVPRASDEIRNIAGMYRGYHSPAQTMSLGDRIMSILGRNVTLPHMLKSYPDMGWLVLFHGNGYLRQAALENLNSAPQSEFEFTAIIYRMNDWVENVRILAERYFKEFDRQTEPSIVGDAAFFLLAQASKLSRWNERGRNLFEAGVYRSEVLNYMKGQFLSQRTGSVGRTLQQVLKRPDFDPELAELARNAKLPSVRAIAMDTLLNDRARWFVGYGKEWINKPLGVSRRVAVFETRPIHVETDFDELLKLASSDRTAQVRKIAADALIAKRHDATAEMDSIAQVLQSDKSSSVQSRIDFYLRERQEKGD